MKRPDWKDYMGIAIALLAIFGAIVDSQNKCAPRTWDEMAQVGYVPPCDGR